MNTRARSSTIFCICHGPESSSMVQCDTCDKWFHFGCVAFEEEKREEDSRWDCSLCQVTRDWFLNAVSIKWFGSANLKCGDGYYGASIECLDKRVLKGIEDICDSG
eukprot:816757_1